MSTVIDYLNHELRGKEGGYADHPSDPGGETMHGITIKVARANGYRGAMREMPWSTALEIYLQEYVKDPKFDQVWVINEELAKELIDTGINMGQGTAAGFLQVALNALNRQGKDYRDIAVDNQLGTNSLNALKAYLARRKERGVSVLLKTLNILQGHKYIMLSQAKQTNEDFTFGWIDARIELPS